MSEAITGAQLVAQLRRWHVPYKPVTRGGRPWHRHHRPASTGSWGDMHGTLNHHTGPYSTVQGMLALLWNGRADLPGPLCQVATGPDGTLYLIGWNGRANHAGAGARNVHQALLAERPPPTPGRDEVDGNACLYGNEILHPGDASPYPAAQIETAVRWNAAVLETHGWQPASALMHEEWTARKVDPSWRDPHTGRDFRAEVAKALSLGPDRYAFGEDDEDMPSPQDYARANWNHREKDRGNPDRQWRMGGLLTHIEQEQDRTQKALGRLGADLAAQQATIEKLTRAVGQLAGGTQVDLEGLVAQVRQASEDGAKAALAESTVDVEVTVRDRTEADA